ncbi:hypothetical protein [Serratia aquatilis]|uniref:Prolamin-like domain-containing protein n=1 Tax=Serratia aquatilis TaxID=1737515 RepID=A0ABV6E9N6_9GAMM
MESHNEETYNTCCSFFLIITPISASNAEPFPFKEAPRAACVDVPIENNARERCEKVVKIAINAAFTTGNLSLGCKMNVVKNDCEDLLKEAAALKEMEDKG